VFEAYFDLSQGNSPIVCMAGYISTVTKWSEFVRKWRQTINKAGISCFHMTDFVARVPPFDKLNETERGRLMRRLVRLMNRYSVASFDLSMLKTDYEEVLLDHQKKVVRSPWIFLALLSMSAVRICAEQLNYSEPIPLLFDRGDRYSGEFKQAYDFWFDHEGDNFIKQFSLGSLTFADRCERNPLQAADVFAYETWRYRSAALKNSDTVKRKSFEQLLRQARYSMFFDRATLSKIMDANEWPILNGS
jgi:hypothetical protein